MFVCNRMMQDWVETGAGVRSLAGPWASHALLAPREHHTSSGWVMPCCVHDVKGKGPKKLEVQQSGLEIIWNWKHLNRQQPQKKHYLNKQNWKYSCHWPYLWRNCMFERRLTLSSRKNSVATLALQQSGELSSQGGDGLPISISIKGPNRSSHTVPFEALTQPLLCWPEPLALAIQRVTHH